MNAITQILQTPGNVANGWRNLQMMESADGNHGGNHGHWDAGQSNVVSELQQELDGRP